MYCRLLERGTQASTSAVTASTSGANIAYWSLLRGKRGPPTEVGRFVYTPEPPMSTRACKQAELWVFAKRGRCLFELELDSTGQCE